MEKYAKEKACVCKPLKMILAKPELASSFCHPFRDHEGCDEQTENQSNLPNLKPKIDLENVRRCSE